MSKILKWTSVEANVIQCSESEARPINLQENLARENLNCLDEATALATAFPESLYGCCAVGFKLGKTPGWVLARRQLMKLPHDIQLQFATGRIPISRVKSVLDAPDPNAAAKSLCQRKSVRQPMPQMKKRTNTEIRSFIVQLHEAGLNGLVTRALAWCSGGISSEDFQRDIDMAIQEGRVRDA